MIAGLKPIETVFRGNRFRSRLEARWAVFFTELGVKYEYEKEGFDLGEAGRYLPDFWLPELEAWGEVKPEAPKYRSPEYIKAKALESASGKRVISLHETPLDRYSDWQVCVVCGSVGHYATGKTNCSHLTSDMQYRSDYNHRVLRAAYAAKQARFEFGESGAASGSFNIPRVTGSIYLAGKMHRSYCRCPGQELHGRGTEPCPTQFDWRSEILHRSGQDKPPFKVGLWTYTGPNCQEDHSNHGMIEHIVPSCFNQIRAANLVFAWIGTIDIHGTMAELGYARACGKTIFVAFDSRKPELFQEVSFASGIADEIANVPGPAYAWKLFEQWVSWDQWRSRA